MFGLGIASFSALDVLSARRNALNARPVSRGDSLSGEIKSPDQKRRY
jgi:hypothetical protein